MAFPAPPSTPSTPSPCIDVCRLDPHTGLCEGCWRTMDEISAWRTATEEDRRAILERVASRKAVGRELGLG